MTNLKLRFIKDGKIVGYQELVSPNGIIDMAYEWDEFNIGTGLHDKNGKPIYEADIVVQDCYMWFDERTPNYRGTVEWIFSEWQVVAHCVNPDKRGISDGVNMPLNEDGFEEGEQTHWIIIGNIFENPELFRAEAKHENNQG